ncbi:hypothetical protein QEM42_003702 [Pseudomonas putida]|uniref:hypothetical protein n=1 Tax=Pseudomonas TaxID=286 RepID=UPI001198ABA2|nr:hypothetical protein [Pseudomonas putida]EKT4562502.1 hypothetical protein [Pseudomonas putida]MDP9541010.1 hypothetical protein [Pseudomonas putida]QDY37940.1 hypothetical protein CHR26_17415 [Pseudomonas putida]
MISIGDKVRVVSECWWSNSQGKFALQGLEGQVYDVGFGDDEDELYVLIPSVGHVLLIISDVEVIK